MQVEIQIEMQIKMQIQNHADSRVYLYDISAATRNALQSK